MALPKSVTIKVLSPDPKGRAFTRVFRADKGCEYTIDGALNLAHAFKDALEKEAGGLIFRVVKLGRGEFNLVPSKPN